jgi:hypothetical protein
LQIKKRILERVPRAGSRFRDGFDPFGPGNSE